MKLIEVKCDLCGKQLKSTDDPIQAKRTLNTHKRLIHNVVSPDSTPEGRLRSARQRHWRLQGNNEGVIQEMEAAFQARKSARSDNQSATPTAEEPLRKTKKSSDAVPLALTECPLCHARFYYTAEQKGQ